MSITYCTIMLSDQGIPVEQCLMKSMTLLSQEFLLILTKLKEEDGTGIELMGLYKGA